jgi:ribonuclease HI
MNKRVTIYSDGGCRPNPGIGAWAAVLEYNGHYKEIVGGDPDTTNNRMELLGAIHALEALLEPCIVEFHTDSQYVKKGITEWMPNWKARGWRRGRGRESAPVRNVDLWKRLDAAIQAHTVYWAWVRGHNGNPLNERCDELCAQEIDRLTLVGLQE